MKNFPIRLNKGFIIALVVSILFISCSSSPVEHLDFNVYVDGKPMEYGVSYSSPNGDGTFTISDFKVYISNVKLFSGNDEINVYSEDESYHLLKFQDDNHFSFSLNNAPQQVYEKISFSLGVDEEANTSINTPGDLDPTNQMAWNWTQGYKFLLLEGLYIPESSEFKIPIVFHIGFNENRADFEFPVSPGKNLDFNIEIGELFKNPNKIDFHTRPKVLFNEKHSAIIRENYENGFINIE